MATQDEIDLLKLLVGSEMLTDAEFGKMIDLEPGNMNLAAARVWEIRAGKYSGLVTISESGSSRQMSDLYKNALELARWYRQKAAEEEQEETNGSTRTRRIVRP